MSKTAPLRKIVGYKKIAPASSVWVEVLECGHVQVPKTDIYGETNAIRRRCRRCELGRPRQLTEAEVAEIAEKNKPSHS